LQNRLPGKEVKISFPNRVSGEQNQEAGRFGKEILSNRPSGQQNQDLVPLGLQFGLPLTLFTVTGSAATACLILARKITSN